MQLPNGSQTQHHYDAQDRLVSVTDAGNNTHEWQYDAQGNITAHTDATGLATTYLYRQGLLHELVTAAGQTITLTYDANADLPTSVLLNGQRSTALFDDWGRLRKATDARGNVRWLEYNLVNQLVARYEPDGNVQRLQYDAVGNLTRLRDRRQDVQYAYRGTGWPIRRAEAGTAIEFLYNTEGQLRAVMNEHGLTYRFDLDALGDVLAETDFGGRTRRYTRDAGGRITELVKPSGQTSRYAYAAGGQLARIQYGDGSSEQFDYSAAGFLLRAQNDAVTVSFSRDAVGRVLRETQGAHSVHSEYTRFGQRNHLSSSLGAAISLHYDAAGEVSQLQAGAWQALIERDAQGLEVHRKLSGGVQTAWKRDALGRPVEQQVFAGRQRTVRQRYYTWQPTSQLSQIQDSFTGPTQFTHDALGNLAATTYADDQQLRWPDAVGNLFRTANRQDRHYGATGELLEAAGTTYTYDADGNLTTLLPNQFTETGWRHEWVNE